MSFICDYCGASFTARRNLTKHVETAQYCIKNRAIIIEKQEPSTSYSCDYCLKLVGRKDNLAKHLVTCTSKKEREEEERSELKKESIELKTEIERLKNENGRQFRRIASLESTVKVLKNDKLKLTTELSNKEGYIQGYKEAGPKTITNNNIHQKLLTLNVSTIPTFTPDNFASVLDWYGIDEFKEGVPGLAKFILSFIKEDTEDGRISASYAPTDLSRNKWSMLNELRTWEKDSGAKRFNLFLDYFKDPVEEYYQIMSKKKDSSLSKDSITNKEVHALLKLRNGIIYPEERLILVDKLRKLIGKQMPIG